MTKIPMVIVAAAFTILVDPYQASSPRARTPDPDFESLKLLFAYDVDAPLDVRSTGVKRTPRATISDVTYVSPKGGRVDAYVVEPHQRGERRPGIVFGHWGPGNRTEFLPEALLYAESGAVCILINYPWTRPLQWRREFQYQDGGADLELAKQAVVDLRRAFDSLIARQDVDRARLAYIGHSYGAQWGAILSAIDKRMKMAILVGGVRASADMWEKNNSPENVKLRQEWPLAKRSPYISRYTAVDAVRYVPYAAPVALYFQFAEFERFFDADSMNAYFEAASEPKTVKWYPTGHDLNDPHAWADRARWLEKGIGLEGASSALRAALQ